MHPALMIVYRRIRRVALFGMRRIRRYTLPKIPRAMITGTNGKTTTSRLLAKILESAGYHVGLATTKAIVIGGKVVAKGDWAGYDGHKRVLHDPNVTAAVLETARGALRRLGLYVDRCDAAALLNVGREQIEMDGINTVEEMARHKRQVIDAARKCVVLNADDPLVSAMADRYPIERCILFSLEPESEFVAQRLRQGNTVYGYERSPQPAMVRRRKGERRRLMSIDEFPLAFGGIAEFNIANALAAAALAEGLGVAWEDVKKGLAAAPYSAEETTGRFCFIDGYSFRLLIDSADSPPAATAVSKATAKIKVSGKRRCMLSCVGNRPDWAFREIGDPLAAQFDRFICYDRPDYRRGRKPFEIANRLREGLIASGVDGDAIRAAPDFDTAIAWVAEKLAPGDLLVILGSTGDATQLSLIHTSLAKFRTAPNP
jgi:cyanophycin synthetase